MSYLLGITIGPVQAYIEDSRKLLDLKNSSKIISDIMKKILEFIDEESTKKDVVYPNHENISDVDYSNYMIIEVKNIVDMKIIENRTYNYFNNFFQGIKGLEYDIREVFHLFWVIIEIENDKYYKTYEELTELIRSLKNTYDFTQSIQSSRKKCLLCGKHNVATIEYMEQDKLNTDENLCTLCLFKRNYNRGKFESVYSIAIKPWKELNKCKIKRITDELSGIFKEKHEDKYYSKVVLSNIIKMLNSNNNYKSSKRFKEIKEDLLINDEDLKKYIGKLQLITKYMYETYCCNEDSGIKNPNYEYCFIQFDIDNLGKWISGKYLRQDDNKNLKEYQQFLSNQLIKFAKILKEHLNNFDCDVIYSGGDDFLGVLPNEDIIQVVEAIENTFKQEVQRKIKERYKGIDKEITYSISITIAQCKDPMRYALSKTRIELENVKARFEKNDIEKNGIAINYIINNGKEISSYLDKNDYKEFVMLSKSYGIVKNKLSFSYINNFENEFSDFNKNEMNFEEARNLYSIMKYELKRLIVRSKIKKEKDDELDEYISRLAKFMERIINKNIIKVRPNCENMDFINIMNVMRITEKFSDIEFCKKSEKEEKHELN